MALSIVKDKRALAVYSLKGLRREHWVLLAVYKDTNMYNVPTMLGTSRYAGVLALIKHGAISLL